MIAHICLGGVSWCADNPNGPGSQTNGLLGQMDVSRGQAGTLNMLNIAVIGGISHGDEPDMYLSPGDTKHDINETDGLGSHADVSGVHLDMPSIEMDALIPTIVPDTISTCPTEVKPQDIPVETERQHSNSPNGCIECTVSQSQCSNRHVNT